MIISHVSHLLFRAAKPIAPVTIITPHVLAPHSEEHSRRSDAANYCEGQRRGVPREVVRRFAGHEDVGCHEANDVLEGYLNAGAYGSLPVA